MDIPNEQPGKISETGRIRCKFELFVRLYPDKPSKFSYGARIWTFRGDKWNDSVDKMLRDLVRNVKNHYSEYEYMEIYDTHYEKNSNDHSLLRIVNNEIKKNILIEQYPDTMNKYDWPEWIKKVVYDTAANHPR